MFVRDMLDASMLRQSTTTPFLGDAMDDVSSQSDGTDPLLVQLHQLALLIVQLRREADAILNQVSNADGTPDMDQLTILLQQIAQYVTEFKRVAAQRTAQNPYALSGADQAILDIGNWAQGVVNALPNAVSAIPNALLDAAGKIIGNAGSDLVGASVPWLIGGGLLLVLVLQAEKSRTYRKAVA